MTSYEEWINWVFDHPVTDPEWYTDESAIKLKIPAENLCEYMIRLFENPVEELKRFSNEQIGQGMYFIADDISSNHMYVMTNKTLDWEKRKIAIRAIYTLFEKLFSFHCGDKLIEESDNDLLNSVCYMWWDIGLIRGFSADLSDKETVKEIISVLEKTLELPSDACRESALHGIGHLYKTFPKKAKKLVNKFLFDNPTLRENLKEYALRASKGQVL